jgi:hypothetical protein
MTDYLDHLDARIDRCECGAWRWDGVCATCGQPTDENRNVA